jgi:signal peptidase II
MTHRNYKVAIYLAVFVTLVDQMSKWWVVEQMHMTTGRIKEICPFFNLVLVHNRGVTFGLLNNIDQKWVTYGLILIAVAIVALLGRWLLRTTSLTVSLALGMIMGGAVGNIIDRIRFGSVVDFLDFYYHDYHWPAFNCADSMIVVGVTLLLLDSMVRAK